MSLEQYLEVKVTLSDPRRVTIGFQKDQHAQIYHDNIKRRSIHADEALDSQRNGRYVSLRLPSRVTEIVASTTYDGFFFTFSDKDLARRWRESLILWRFIQQSSTKLYIVRGWTASSLNDQLGLVPPSFRRDLGIVPPAKFVYSSPFADPGQAVHSRGPTIQ